MLTWWVFCRNTCVHCTKLAGGGDPRASPGRRMCLSTKRSVEPPLQVVCGGPRDMGMGLRTSWQASQHRALKRDAAAVRRIDGRRRIALVRVDSRVGRSPDRR